MIDWERKSAVQKLSDRCPHQSVLYGHRVHIIPPVLGDAGLLSSACACAIAADTVGAAGTHISRWFSAGFCWLAGFSYLVAARSRTPGGNCVSPFSVAPGGDWG